MKDDFYKDMEHTRREQKDKSAPRERRRTKVDPELSRSARYKEEKKKQKEEYRYKLTSKKQTSKKSATKISLNNNRLKDGKGKKTSFATIAHNAKKYLLTTREKYQKQLGSELNESKGKLKGLKASAFLGLRTKGNNKKWKILLLLILTPIALLFAFLIISNFWPSKKDYTADVEDSTPIEAISSREVTNDFEQKKAELEKEFAARKDDDSATSNTETTREYSKKERAAMKSEADRAIEKKKKQENEAKTTDPEASESIEPSENEQDTVGATHVVTSSDNLYRIAIQYYGSGSEENVQKIRKANGISGNDLSVGQELIIP